MDDLFAKKEKKKVKSRRAGINPNELFEKMTRGSGKEPKEPTSSVADIKKNTLNIENSEEWEAIDDEEKEIDLQNLRINTINNDDTNDEKGEEDSQEKLADVGQDKPVWFQKKSGPPVPQEKPVEDKPEPPPSPEDTKPKPFRPSFMKGGTGTSFGSTGPSIPMIKPKLDSLEDFPSLGSADEIAAAHKAEKERQIAEAKLLADSSQGKWLCVGSGIILTDPGHPSPGRPFSFSGLRLPSDHSGAGTPSPSFNFKLSSSTQAAIKAKLAERNSQPNSSFTSSDPPPEKSQPFACFNPSFMQFQSDKKWARGDTINQVENAPAPFLGQQRDSSREVGFVTPKQSFEISQTNRFSGLENLNATE